MSRTFVVKLGCGARANIERDGLAPSAIRCVPAAAGGPKGLALMPFDRWLFGEWLRDASDLTLVGASIGAWRMAAAVHDDPAGALLRLQRGYIEDQNYGLKPGPAEVAALMRDNVRKGFGEWRPRDGIRLHVLTSRAVGALARGGSRRAFARATLANARGRSHLASHLQRVVFSRGGAGRRGSEALFGNDAFGATHVPMTQENALEALLASGSIPILCETVADIPGAPQGCYWDGGLIDYHPFFPYSQLDGLTLYPHFTPSVTPGWLDKFLPWRKQGVRGRGADWLSTTILIAPTPEFLATLPNGRLPDRRDFHHYGPDHKSRIAAWNRAVAECQRFADDSAAWLQNPDLSVAQSF